MKMNCVVCVYMASRVIQRADYVIRGLSVCQRHMEEWLAGSGRINDIANKDEGK